jgi:hypothetical protein
MNRPTVPRRHFLRAGGVLMALPWLESLAWGAENSPPKRMVQICTSFGLYAPAFFPTKAGRDFEPSDYLSIIHELRDKYTVFSGISHPEIGGDHASEACFLTSAKHPTKGGFRNTVSLDYVAAKHVAGATRFPLLTLSTLDSSPLTYTPSGAGVPALATPSQIFARMFLAGNRGEVQQEIDRLKRGQSVMDRMAARFSELHKTASALDRQQLDDYGEAVRDMERQLVADEAWVNRPKPKVDEPQPSESYPSPFADRSDSIGRARVMLNLIRLALKTDSTRVATLFIRGMDDKPPIKGVTEGHHGLTHHGQNPAKIAQLKIVERLEMTVFRDFLKSLRDTHEAGQSLLDNTQVLIGSNLGDASGHGTTNLPILLAGGGYQHGQHIAGNKENNTPLGKLFVNMLQRFGAQTDKFGSGEGTITGLS